MRGHETILGLLCLGALGAASCGGTDAAPSDAGPRDGAAADASDGAIPTDLTLPSGATLALPLPPAAPAPPSLEPCRAGWRAVPSPDGPTVCDPWPATGRATCALGQAHFPGEPSCRVIGSACPAGAWPADLPATGVLYVLATAPAGGTGTTAAPFATIADALAAATPGTLVVVGRGTYDEAVTLTAGVSLRGVCAAETRIVHTARDAAPATVRITGADVTVSDVQLAGSRSGLLVDIGGDATVTGVLVDRATEAGLRVHRRAHGALSDVVVTHTLTDPDDHVSAWGIVVELGGVATASKIVVTDSRFGGVIATDAASTLTIDDVAVLDTLATETGARFGIGVAAQHGAMLTVHGAVIDGATYGGLVSGLDGARVEAEDLVVRRVAPDSTGIAMGIGATQMGIAHVVRALVEQTVHGVHAESGASMEIEDAVIRSLRTDTSVPDVDNSVGVVAHGATVTCSRVQVEDAGYLGLGAFDGSAMHVADLVVRGNGGGLDGSGGSGLAFVDSTGDVARALVTHNRYGGVTVSGPTALVQLTDVTIDDIAPQMLGSELGRGLQAQDGATAQVERMLVTNTHANAVMVIASATLTGTDLEVRETHAGLTGTWTGIGTGLAAQGSSTVTLDRVRIGESIGWAVKLDPPASQLTLENAWVHDVTRFGRAPIGGTTAGRAIDVNTATSTFRRVIVERARDVGVYIYDGSAELSDVVVRDTQGDEVAETGGDGIDVTGATVSLIDVLLERNRDTSLFVNYDATLTGTRVRVLDSLQAQCATTTCVGTAGGIGIASTTGGEVTLTDFLVSRAALCGVQVAGGGMDLHSGRVERCLIGANVQDPGFDFARLSDMVQYTDNERNLDSSSLPVPVARTSVDAIEPP